MPIRGKLSELLRQPNPLRFIIVDKSEMRKGYFGTLKEIVPEGWQLALENEKYAVYSERNAARF